MLYEKLNPEMRHTVDLFAERLSALPWARRSDALAEAAGPFTERFTAQEARLASQGFLTAVLERLAPPAVSDPHQAVLHLLSLNPAHRRMARRWLAEHPDVRVLVDRELAGGGGYDDA
jgi:hypothetical protein